MSTQTVGQAVASVPKAVEVAKANRERFATVLPDHIDAKAFIGLAAGALYRDPKLLEAAGNNAGAFANALMECAALGHQPGSAEYYLIPRRNKKNRNQTEIQGIEGYRGIIERMYRSGAIASVKVREVCANDSFEFVEGENDKPIHKWNPWDPASRGDMIGVYAYAVLNSGATSRVVLLSKADVMAAKAAGDGGDSDYSPWNRLDAGKELPGFTGRAMWWKTAARRLEPWVPTSAEFFKERVRAAAELSHTTTERPAQAAQPETGQGDDVVDAELVEDGPAPDA
jgi:recombination protein RecT